MLPYLIDIVIHGHHLRIPTYGFMLAVGFSSAYILWLRSAIKIGIDTRHIENVFLIVVASAAVGSRLFHVIFENWSYYVSHPYKTVAVWEGGYTFYGGLLPCLLAAYCYCRKHRISFLTISDIAAAPIALGLGFGRLGCFGAGCCWGKVCNSPWAVTFRNPESFTSFKNVPLHPTQLYESFGAFLICGYLLWRLKHNKKYPGQLIFQWLILYALLRFIVEFFRGDAYRGFVFNGILSNSQLVSIFLVLCAIYGMLHFARKEKQADTPPDPIFAR